MLAEVLGLVHDNGPHAHVHGQSGARVGCDQAAAQVHACSGLGVAAVVTARLSPRRDGRGLSLALTPQWGAATGAAEALWRDEMPRLHGAAARAGGTLDTNLGYGIALAARGVLTPFATARLSGYGQGLRLGTRSATSRLGTVSTDRRKPRRIRTTWLD